MSKISTYLNFPGTTEEAFNFYKSVFGGEFIGGIHRFGEVPPAPGVPPISETDKNLVMHVALEIFDGYLIMGTDAPESMGFKLNAGNNVYINIEPDTREEADKIFNAMSVQGKIEMPMQEVFWGAYYGAFKDKYGVQWMVNCANK
jgi:PhnB protein